MRNPLGAKQRDRWLLSYADFITMLFAAFVLMYASARAREAPKSAPVHPVKAPAGLLDELRSSLTAEQANGVTIRTEPRGVVITVNYESCFQPGRAEVQPSAIAGFEKIGAILKRYPNRILLEGHTDSVPIHTGVFHSNWELSTSRSIAVMELLEQHSGIDSDRFSIGGSANNAPVSTDNTEEGRARNRRVDIIVLDAADLVSLDHPARNGKSAVSPDLAR